MNFIEGRLLGIQIDETGREAVLLLIDTAGARCVLELHGVERLLVTEMRQQNVIEELVHWTKGESSNELREAAFALMTGGAEQDCSPTLAAAAEDTVAKVARGDLSMLEIRAIFGAQVLASFASLTTRSV